MTVATLPFINLPNLNTTRRINRAHAYAPFVDVTKQTKEASQLENDAKKNFAGNLFRPDLKTEALVSVAV